MLVFALLALAAGRFPWGITRGDDMAALFLGLAAASGCWLLATSGSADTGSAVRRLSGPWAGLALALLIGSIVASDRVIAFLGAPQEHLGLVQVLATGAAFLGAIVASSDIRRDLPTALLVVFGLQLGYGLWQLASGLNVRGTLPNSAYLGQALLLAAPIVATGVPQLGRWRLAVPVVSLALLVVAGAAAPAALMLAWLVLDVTGERLSARARTGALGAVTVGAWLLAPLAALVPAAETALSGRWWYWPAAFAEWLASPLTGIGLGGFRGVLYRRGPAGLFELESDGSVFIGGVSPDPHSIVMAILVFGGLLAAAVLAWLAVVFARVAAERLRSDKAAEPYLHAALLCMGTFAVQPAPVFTLPLLALVAGAALGSGVEKAAGKGAQAATAGDRVGVTGGTGRTTAARALAILVLVLGILGSAGTLAKAATYLYTGPTAEPMTQASALRAQSAADLWGVDHYLYYEASLRWGYLGVAGNADAAVRDRAAIDRACALAPYEAVYALERARVVRSYGGTPDEITAAFAEAVRLAPNAPRVRAEAVAAGAQLEQP